jgi:plastocyanin domain-containing protein
MKNMKGTIISVVFSLLVVGVALFANFPKGSSTELAHNVSMEGDTQIVAIKATGGYQPRVSEAKAGIPTVLRVETNGTYDCSASLSVPDANFRGFLKPTGIEEIKLSPQKVGAVVKGICSMGMYNFSVNFN